jgi:30S ribosomal protein S31
MLGYAPVCRIHQGKVMGKGDRRTTKGKRNISSYGKSRPVTSKTVVGQAVAAAPKAAKPAVAAKKAPAKKAAAK